MKQIEMKEIHFLSGWKIAILLSDGKRVEYEMKPKLHTARFCDLELWDLFSAGKLINSHTICWKAGVELTLEEILLEQCTER